MSHVIDQRASFPTRNVSKKCSLSKNSKRVITEREAERLLRLAESSITNSFSQPKKKKRSKRAIARRKAKDELNELKVKVMQLEEFKSKFQEIPKYVPGMKSDFYKTREWKSLRWAVISESNGTCQVCSRGRKDGVVLHVDHIKPRSRYPELELEKSNLQVLCEDCNIGKGAKRQTF